MNKKDLVLLKDEYQGVLNKKRKLTKKIEEFQSQFVGLQEQLEDHLGELDNLIGEIENLESSLFVKLDKILDGMKEEDENVVFKFKNESSISNPKESVTNKKVSSPTKEESSSKEDKKATEKKSKSSCYDKYIKEAASYLDPWELKLLAKLATIM